MSFTYAHNAIETYCGELVIQRVIPAAAALSQALPLSFETLLSRESLVGIGMEGDSSSLKCTSLEQSDKVFESLKLKYGLSY